MHISAIDHRDEDPTRFLDERDVLPPGEVPPPIEGASDIWANGAAHSAAAAALEDVSIRMNALIAEQYASISAMLEDAQRCPDPWVGPDPTLDPGWVDPRDRSAAEVRRERREIAVRATVADIATRLHVSETTVRTRATLAGTLRARCPQVWDGFRSGWIVEQNAVTAARLAASLPDVAEVWTAFDDRIAEAAASAPPGAFRLRARNARERVHPESVDERHRRAAADRRVWLEPELDGMTLLSALLPAADAAAAFGRVDADARHLHDQRDETRTLAQLRADALVDLLSSGRTEATGRAPRATIAITVPVMTLLGRSDEPAMLDGYGPIDIDTAKRLAGEAASWVRILTHPVTGTVLDVDRTTYRVPKALRRWLGVQHPVCVFAGCARPAKDCQIDHRLDWQFGGKTAGTNLAPLCEPHHVVKTESEWTLHRDPATGATWWISPTGRRVETDPPPW
jgi:hypothetical protein